MRVQSTPVPAMKTLPVAAFAVTALTAALAMPYSPRVEAGIQRCQAADGTVVYTDQACGAMGAQNLAMGASLAMRIAREQAQGAPTLATADAMQAMPVAAARRSAASGCARSPAQLTMDLQGAFALRDVNRLAESYHWTGMSHRAGQATMQRLERLATQPLAEARFFDASIGSGLDAYADASQSGGASAGGVMQLSLGEGAVRQVVDFAVERYQGCYFIRE